jgi:hypothetical protein
MSHTTRTANRRARRQAASREARTPQAIARHEAKAFASDELSAITARHYRRIAGECARHGFRLLAS